MAGAGNLSWGGGMTSGTGRGGKEDRNQDATTYCGNLDSGSHWWPEYRAKDSTVV